MWAYQKIQNSYLITSYSDIFEYNLNEAVYRGRGYFGAKSKGYNATMKRGIKNLLWEWVIYSEKKDQLKKSSSRMSLYSN